MTPSSQAYFVAFYNRGRLYNHSDWTPPPSPPSPPLPGSVELTVYPQPNVKRRTEEATATVTVESGPSSVTIRRETFIPAGEEWEWDWNSFTSVDCEVLVRAWTGVATPITSTNKATVHWEHRRRRRCHLDFILFFSSWFYSSTFTFPSVYNTLGQSLYIRSGKRLGQRIQLQLFVFKLLRFQNTRLHGWHIVHSVYVTFLNGVIQRLCFPFTASRPVYQHSLTLSQTHCGSGLV